MSKSIPQTKPHSHETSSDGSHIHTVYGIQRIHKAVRFHGAGLSRMKEIALDEAKDLASRFNVQADSFEAIPVGMAEVDVVARANGNISAIIYIENRDA